MKKKKIKELGNIFPKFSQKGIVVSAFGICPTLCGLGQGGNNEPKVLIKVKHETNKD